MRKAKSPDLALPRNVPGFQKLLKARKFLSKAELYFCLEESSLDNLPPKPHCWWGPKMQLDKFRIVSWNWEAKCWSGGGFGYVTCGWGIHRCPHLHPHCCLVIPLQDTVIMLLLTEDVTICSLYLYWGALELTAACWLVVKIVLEVILVSVLLSSPNRLWAPLYLRELRTSPLPVCKVLKALGIDLVKWTNYYLTGARNRKLWEVYTMGNGYIRINYMRYSFG